MAQQFQSPENYDVGQQVTKSRLNNMVNNAVPLPGLITDRTALASNTIASDDKFLIVDTSASALRSANASDILGSGIPLTTSGISYSGQDIQINVDDSTPITTASFVSADGITVTVTATAHGFTPGGTNLIEVSGAPSTYNGIFVFNYVNANTFTYTTLSTGTPVTSPTVITVKRKGSIRNASSVVTNSHLSVTQQSIFGGSIYAKQNLNISGALNCASTASITGNLTVTGNITKGGTNNYNLYSITRVRIPGAIYDTTVDGRYSYSSIWYLTTGKTLYTESFIVPAGEIWELNYDLALWVHSDDGFGWYWLLNGQNDDYSGMEYQVGAASPLNRPSYIPANHSVLLSPGTSTVSLKVAFFSGSGLDMIYQGLNSPPGKYILRKYKI
jgi:hypothetical protein